ncbi:DoxX family protein [Mycobacterium szulgai]|uniref:DoxX family protein n=1 Tax=Mycobacterium szulgai TaxID=1787 RepID=A0A1X2DLR8_MYCSZ|nr:DoxX family protein [Mycobacterium szulgai]MCV7074657.1 DoxX family protein [Mycobacterium szulgai]ORW89112.1 hypothetical protein AWC27_13525 [Mycobacterium szulgai]
MTLSNAAYLAVVVTTAIVTAGIALPDLIPAEFVLANSARVNVPRSWLPTLAVLKLAGAGGLVVGLLGLSGIGIAAATGLVLYFIGAVIAHVRAGVFSNIAFPGCYLLLSIASLALMVMH